VEELKQLPELLAAVLQSSDMKIASGVSGAAPCRVVERALRPRTDGILVVLDSTAAYLDMRLAEVDRPIRQLESVLGAVSGAVGGVRPRTTA
jgi:hypothetical protein